jgi:hypothetical protein
MPIVKSPQDPEVAVQNRSTSELQALEANGKPSIPAYWESGSISPFDSHSFSRSRICWPVSAVW